MCRRTIYDARNNLSALIKIAESGEPVELTRHNKPVAVIISWEDFEQTKPKSSFVDAVMKIREKYADVFEDPTFEGLVIPKDEPLDKAYIDEMKSLWEE